MKRKGAMGRWREWTRSRTFWNVLGHINVHTYCEIFVENDDDGGGDI